MYQREYKNFTRELLKNIITSHFDDEEIKIAKKSVGETKQYQLEKTDLIAIKEKTELEEYEKLLAIIIKEGIFGPELENNEITKTILDDLTCTDFLNLVKEEKIKQIDIEQFKIFIKNIINKKIPNKQKQIKELKTAISIVKNYTLLRENLGLPPEEIRPKSYLRHSLSRIIKTKLYNLEKGTNK